ncbi:hypothetical protein FACS189432_05550 [Bacteroidia bacterium]|nr:hypothetical protein FACS189426_21080 [Bacteroidia bacterium]GHT28088.1 hypothetical protein FACS189432_05550 [Bacteroidia bacterium]
MNKQTLLSTLWVFLSVNYIFCDVFTLMYSEELQKIIAGKAGEIEITQSFLLVSAIIMEMSMIMILLSRLLKFQLNKWLNIVIPLLLLCFQAGSLIVDTNTLHYWFFSIIEIVTCISIFLIALGWKNPRKSVKSALSAF